MLQLNYIMLLPVRTGKQEAASATGRDEFNKLKIAELTLEDKDFCQL